jgi:hypothetical protein
MIVAGAIAAYAVVWFLVTRHLFLTHEAPSYQWEHRDYRFDVAMTSMVIAFMWPFGLVYLAITRKGK